MGGYAQRYPDVLVGETSIQFQLTAKGAVYFSTAPHTYSDALKLYTGFNILSMRTVGSIESNSIVINVG